METDKYPSLLQELDERCIKIMKLIDPEKFLHDIKKETGFDYDVIRRCIQGLAAHGLVTEAPREFTSVMIYVRILNILISKSIPLVGKTIVRREMKRLLERLPDEARSELHLDEGRLRIGITLLHNIREQPESIYHIDEHKISSIILAVKKVTDGLFAKLGEILGTKLKSRLYRAIKEDIKEKFGIIIY